jgi:hypothetical protein
MMLADVLGRVERRLRVDLGVVLLDDALAHDLEVFLRPVELEVASDRVAEALVALEDLFGAGDALRGEECGERALLRDLRVREALPVAEVAGAGDAQGVVCRARDGDGVRDLVDGQAERLRGGRGGGVRALHRVVEALRAHRGDVGEAGVHLVGDREGGDELLAARVDRFGGREGRAEVVARVVRLALGEVRVHEVEVAAEAAVVERGAFGGGLAAADEGGGGRAAEVVDEFADRDHRVGVERADGDAEGVENADLQLLDRFWADVVERCAVDEFGETLHFCRHGAPSCCGNPVEEDCLGKPYLKTPCALFILKSRDFC